MPYAVHVNLLLKSSISLPPCLSWSQHEREFERASSSVAESDLSRTAPVCAVSLCRHFDCLLVERTEWWQWSSQLLLHFALQTGPVMEGGDNVKWMHTHTHIHSLVPRPLPAFQCWEKLGVAWEWGYTYTLTCLHVHAMHTHTHTLLLHTHIYNRHTGTLTHTHTHQHWCRRLPQSWQHIDTLSREIPFGLSPHTLAVAPPWCHHVFSLVVAKDDQISFLEAQELWTFTCNEWVLKWCRV